MAVDHAPMWFTRLVEAQVAVHGSQAALARRVGKTQQSVSNWLKGQRPDPEGAIRLAELAGVDPLEMLRRLWIGDGDDDPDGPDDAPPAPSVASTAELARVEALVAELGRHLAEMPQANPAAWSSALRKAALGGDADALVPAGPASFHRPKVGSFDPDEQDEDLEP